MEEKSDNTEAQVAQPVDPSAQPEPQPDPIFIEQPAPDTQTHTDPLPHKHVNKLLIAVIGVCLLVLIATPFAVWLVMRPDVKQPAKVNKQPVTAKQQASSEIAATKRICFVRVGHLVCIDQSAGNPVRYDLPAISTGQYPSEVFMAANGSKFVALYGRQRFLANDQAQLWLLNDKLLPERQLSFGTLPIESGYFALSSDGTVLYATLPDGNTGTNGDAIYSYDVTNNKQTKIKKTPLPAAQIAQTQDGHIVYGVWDGQRGLVRVMNADGSDDHTANLSPISSVSGGTEFSYDITTDTFFLLGNGGSNDPSTGTSHMAYVSGSDLVAGRAISLITSPAPQSVQRFVKLHEGYAGLSDAKIMILDAKGAVSSTYANAGPLVGLLETAKFTKSATQTETYADLIAGYRSSPTDFQQFIAPVYDKESSDCNYGPQYTMAIYGVVRDTYAKVIQVCGDGGPVFYQKSQGKWAQVDLYGQALNSCSKVNEYRFTKELIQACDNNGQPVANTNP